MSVKLPNSIFVIDSHTAGHPTRIVVGGLPKIPGDSVIEKRTYVKENMDYIRTFLMYEPRGHYGMFGAILTEPSNKDADFGVIWLDSRGYIDMCGHGILGIATVAVETGMVQVKEPLTEVKLETPAGLVKADVGIKGGKVQGVSLVNVPSFLYQSDMPINVSGYGTIKGDIVYAGVWFLYIDAEELGIRVKPENIDALIKAANTIKDKLNKELELIHPTNSDVSKKLCGVSQ